MTGKTWPEIVAIVRQRQLNQGPLVGRMMQVRERYNGDVAFPSPVVEDRPAQDPGTPLLIADAIDNNALRAGGVLPGIFCPPLSGQDQTGPGSRQYASMRRHGLKAMWAASRANLQLRRAFRHHFGYATTALTVMWNDELAEPMPTFSARDPLGCYPEDRAPEDLTPIANCAFVHGKSRDWILRKYPQAGIDQGGVIPITPLQTNPTDLWDVAEWVDEHSRVIGVLGPRDGWVAEGGLTMAGDFAMFGTQLESFPNYAGRCTVVMPHAVTLDRILSQISNLVGTVDLYGRLQTLDFIATEKSIFPDLYVIGESGVRLVDGAWHDGRTGKTNILENASSVGALRQTPDPTNRETISNLERSFRVSSGLVPQMGGETWSQMRTGRANDSIMASAVDPRIQEAHEVFAPELELVNELALDLWANHPACRGKTYSLYSGSEDSAIVEFEPTEHVETHHNVVTYAVPGSDLQGTTINLGQLVGAGMMSKRSARHKHPLISDPEAEERSILEEQLEEAAFASIAAKAQGGELPLEMLARIEKHSRAEPDIFSALRKVDEEVRAEQAAMPEAPPGGPPLPEMQAGMDGMPLPAGQPPIGPDGMPMQMPGEGPPPGEMGPTSNQQGLRALINATAQGVPTAPGA
jgi:hypothetical protein